MRTRDGRALVAIRDHYLSAEIMGINLTKYRTLSFGLAAFFAGIAGALYAHYQLVVSNEGLRHRTLDPFSGDGHHRRHRFDHGHADGHRLRGAAAGIDGVDQRRPERHRAIDKALSLNNNITFLREIAIGLIIIAFLMFEPDGLAHRWRQIKTYWKLYPFSH